MISVYFSFHVDIAYQKLDVDLDFFQWSSIRDWYSLAAKVVPEDQLAISFFASIYEGFVSELGHKEHPSAILIHEELKQLTSKGDPSAEQIATSSLMNQFILFPRYHVFLTTEHGCVGIAPLGTEPGILFCFCFCFFPLNRFVVEMLWITDRLAQTGDIISVLLGCNYVMILRPIHGGVYKVVGPAYIHGLNHGQALLGPIPELWAVKIRRPGITQIWEFLNTETGIQSGFDPRLGPLPNEWTSKCFPENLDLPKRCHQIPSYEGA